MHTVTDSAGHSAATAIATSSNSQRRAGSRDGRMPLREVARLYFDDYTGRDHTRVQRVNWWVDRMGDKPIGDIIDDDIAEALDELRSKPALVFSGVDAFGKRVYKRKDTPMSGGTINRYLSAIAAVLTYAERRRMLPRGWVHPCRTVDKPSESKPRTRFLSEAEAQRLLEACKRSRWPRLYALVLTALVTGCRRGELERLKWRDVDLDKGLATIAETKNDDVKVVPLTPEAVEALRPFVEPPDALVFRSARDPKRPHVFDQVWRRALRDARLKDVCFHTLRHSCASMLVSRGVSLFMVQQVLGHRTPAMSSRYSHLATKDKAEAVRSVFAGFGAQSWAPPSQTSPLAE